MITILSPIVNINWGGGEDLYAYLMSTRIFITLIMTKIFI